MAPFAKIPWLLAQPVAPGGNNRLFSNQADGIYQPLRGTVVPTHPTNLPFNVQRNEQLFALVAHTRGVPGVNCRRRVRGNYCVFADTIVIPYVGPNNQRIMRKCTSCHFQADGTDCGAVPAGPVQGNALLPAPVQVAQAPPPPPAAPVAGVQPAIIQQPAIQQAVPQGGPGVGRGMGGGGNHGMGRGRGGVGSSGMGASPRSNASSESFQTAESGHLSPQETRRAGVFQGGRRGDLTERNVSRLPESLPNDFDAHTSYPSLPEEDGGSGNPYDDGLKDFSSRENALRYAERVGIQKALDDLEAEKRRFFAHWRGRPDDGEDPFGGSGGGAGRLFQSASIS